MHLRSFTAITYLLLLMPPAHAQQASSAIARVKAVGKEGAGNVDAAAAWKELVLLGPAVLPDVLAGLDDATPTAANWLRAAVEQIRDDALKANLRLPADRFEAFVDRK